MDSLDYHSLQRLGLIRYLFLRAVAQAGQPHPLSSLAVLELHDAIEWFLLLASEVGNANVNQRGELMEYWGALEKSTNGKRPGSYQQMKRLSDARRQLKHRGVQPAQSEISSFVTICDEFFREETERFFGISFAAISLGALIVDNPTRDRFRSAEDLASQQNFKDATIQVCKTFHIAHARNTGHVLNDAKILDMRLFGSMNPFENQMEGILRGIVSLVTSLGEQVTRLQIGQDPASVARFFSISPTFVSSFNPDEPVCFLPQEFAPSRDDYRFCERFTLTYLLAFQEAM